MHALERLYWLNFLFVSAASSVQSPVALDDTQELELENSALRHQTDAAELNGAAADDPKTLSFSSAMQADASEHMQLLDRSQRDLHLLSRLGRKAPHGDLDDWYQKLNTNLAEKGMVVTEGNSNDDVAAAEQNKYSSTAEQSGLKTVCETGFNAGHSALRFLVLSDAQVFEFDLGAHDYAHESANFLLKSFPGRLTVTWGDSTKSLPEFRKTKPSVKCDLVIVDGGHDASIAMADLRNFASMVSEEHTLVIDDAPCGKPWCQGPAQSWAELKKSGCIVETERMPMGPDRGFSVGRYAPDKC